MGLMDFFVLGLQWQGTEDGECAIACPYAAIVFIGADDFVVFQGTGGKTKRGNVAFDGFDGFVVTLADEVALFMGEMFDVVAAGGANGFVQFGLFSGGFGWLDGVDDVEGYVDGNVKSLPTRQYILQGVSQKSIQTSELLLVSLSANPTTSSEVCIVFLWDTLYKAKLNAR